MTTTDLAVAALTTDPEIYDAVRSLIRLERLRDARAVGERARAARAATCASGNYRAASAHPFDAREWQRTNRDGTTRWRAIWHADSGEWDVYRYQAGIWTFHTSVRCTSGVYAGAAEIVRAQYLETK